MSKHKSLFFKLTFDQNQVYKIKSFKIKFSNSKPNTQLLLLMNTFVQLLRFKWLAYRYGLQQNAMVSFDPCGPTPHTRKRLWCCFWYINKSKILNSISWELLFPECHQKCSILRYMYITKQFKCFGRKKWIKK